MEYLYPIIFAVAFLATLLAYSPVKKFFFRIGIRAIDQQKKNKPLLPTSAGIIALVGLLGGVFFFIGSNSFLLHSQVNLSVILAASFTIFITTFIGFLDDINISPTLKIDKGIKDFRIGLKQWQKPLLVLPAAIPLMAVRAGVTQMTLPIIGSINFGILYPLILIPLALVFVTNTTNMLAGMNGLETGLGLVSTLSIGIYSFALGRPEAAIIAFSAAGALATVIIFNWSPAKILPGDSLTYLTGAAIATSIIVGNIEKFGIIIFIPWIAEFVLKLRSKFKARSLGTLQPDMTLKSTYKKTYSLTHIFMKAGKLKENKIALYIILLEVVVCGAALLTLIGSP